MNIPILSDEQAKWLLIYLGLAFMITEFIVLPIIKAWRGK